LQQLQKSVTVAGVDELQAATTFSTRKSDCLTAHRAILTTTAAAAAAAAAVDITPVG
jgi:hypothetical protein